MTGAARVDGETGVWAITVTPDTREDLSISLPPAADCGADGAVCTSDGRALSNGTAAIVTGPGPEPLTASLERLPEGHDGETAFRFRAAFSEDIGIGYQSMRDHSFTVSGGEVTKARRVSKRHDLWEITIAPDSDGDVAIMLPGNRECGTAGAVCTRGNDPSQLTNSPSATVDGPADDAREPNTEATGAPAISGTPQVGETLTADTSGIADEDGLENASFSYQWIRSDGGTDTDIVGETNSTYTLVSADQGKTIKVKVTFTDDADNQESLTSAATAMVVAKPNTAPTCLATISGTAQVDETLTAGTSDIADEDGLTNVSYSYQWMRSDGGTDTDIVGETNSTYTLVSADQGKNIKVQLGFRTTSSEFLYLISAPTEVVAKPNSPATGAPTISGTAPRGPDLDGGHVGYYRRRRAHQRFLRVPVAGRRVGHLGGHRLQLPAHLQ